MDGVDSSVSALILKNKGYDVVGTTLNLFPCTSCCSYEDVKNVCRKIGIPHYIIEAKDEFKSHVIDNFIDSYKKCITPNPCIECNRYLKFGKMYEKAKQLGIDYISTGHYAIIEYSKEYKTMVLKKSKNILKDQSYVLYNIPRQIMDKIIFPLGEFKDKEDVRKIARQNFLDIASKPDSEDICFIPDGNYKKFLEENSDIVPKEGNIVNLNKEVLGKHQGLYKYTIGQRKGLGISNKVPLFVIGFNIEENELIVGEEKDIYKEEMMVKDTNFLLFDSLKEKMKVKVKTRYSANQTDAIIEPVEKNLVKVKFENPVPRITPGQSAVFYIEDIVVGGGKII